MHRFIHGLSSLAVIVLLISGMSFYFNFYPEASTILMEISAPIWVISALVARKLQPSSDD